MRERLSGLLCALLAGASPGAKQATCSLDLPRYSPRTLPFPRGASYVTPGGKVRIVGYNDMGEMLTAMDALFTDAHPEFAFELVLRGTRTAPGALLRGESALAPMGAEMSAADLAALRAAAGADPLLIRVAHASLDPRALSSPTAIFVHRDNPLAALSIDEARRVFTAAAARALRWGDLGLTGDWAARPIHPVGLSDRTALGQFMQKHKFGGAPFADNFVGFGQSRDVIAEVMRDPLAIGFANLSGASPRARALPLSEHAGGPTSLGSREDLRAGKYPLDRHLLIYVRRSAGGEIDPLAREYLGLVLSCEGQEAIARGSLGYVPLSRAEVESERLKLR